VVPDVPRVHDAHVMTTLDVVTGRSPVRSRALVVGGLDNHIAAGTIAEFLADNGTEVEYVSEEVDFAPGAEDGTRLAPLHRLMNEDVTVIRCTKLVSAVDGGAHVEQTFTHARRTVPDVTVVLACGLVPNDALAWAVRERIPEVHTMDDALAPRRLMHATLEGARVGRLL
jgi:pyruvate/2-oxoglutarate dehydrogenase complex dihydrolipoamide dehydrogenase (E3) component